MSTIGTGNEATVSIALKDLRLISRQFALLYFHFCKSLKDALGDEAAFPVVQKTVFNLSIDRTNRTRKKAIEQGLETNVDNFPKVNDLPSIAWSLWEPEMGGVRCPYAEVWLDYFPENQWFKRYASLYCDVIDTTNIENFTRSFSHKILKNLVWGDSSCEREYFESDDVKNGNFTFGKA